MADWKKLLVENPPASDIASSPSSGKVLKVSANGTSVEWADDAGGAFQITGSNAHYTAGSVGIGTNSPTEALHVEGAIQQTKIKIYNSGNQGFIDHSGAFGGSTFFIRQLGNNHDIRFQTNKGGSTTTALALSLIHI